MLFAVDTTQFFKDLSVLRIILIVKIDYLIH